MLEVTLQIEKIGLAHSKLAPQVKLIPVIIENYSTPRPATEEESKRILNKIGETETQLR